MVLKGATFNAVVAVGVVSFFLLQIAHGHTVNHYNPIFWTQNDLFCKKKQENNFP